jgi:ATP synthase protein I
LSTPSGTVAQADDPYAAMLRGSLVPTLVVGAVCLVVAGVLAAGPGLVGAGLALAIVCLSFSATLLVMRWAARNGPANVMAAALATYMGKVLVLGVFLVLFGRASWLDGPSFGLTAIVCAVVWLVFEARAYYRMRVLVFGDQVLPGQGADEGPR